MVKVIAMPPANEREAFIQIASWTRPQGGPWVAIRDKTSNAVYAWRHYFPAPQAAEERTGIVPPPEASVSLDGGVTWSPLKGVDEATWVSALKADTFCHWHVRRESGKLLARKSK